MVKKELHGITIRPVSLGHVRAAKDTFGRDIAWEVSKGSESQAEHFEHSKNQARKTDLILFSIILCNYFFKYRM